MNTTETARGSLQLNHIRSLMTKLSNMDEHARVMFVEANHTIAVVRFEGGLGYRAGSQTPHKAPDQPGRKPHRTVHGRATPAVGQNVPWGGTSQRFGATSTQLACP